MTFTLRPYQQEAVDATLAWFRRHTEPAAIVLPTGAGKSLVIAELARLARGRVLVLAHVKELVAQNHAKYCALGLEADIFAAGLQRKESHGKVVFGSVQSVARNLDQFRSEFSLLIVDECHRISDDDDSQYQQIIGHLRQVNPQIRLLGLTATPFRLGKGWIYQFHYHGMVPGDEKALFRDCIYELPLRYMIKHGYLTPPERLDMPVVQYDFSRLQAQSNGLFSEADLNHELKKQQRITPHIVSQIVEFAENRKGVMIFAATVEHAREVTGLLPVGQAALNFLAACERPEVETRCRKNRATDCSLSPLLTLIVHRHPFRRRKGELSCVDGAVLLRFQLIAAALIILLDGAELMDSAVPTDVDRELLEVAAAAFWRQHKIIAILLDIILLPVAGLVAGNQHKRRITGGIFQPGCRSLLNERVIEPQCFTVRNQNAFVRLSHMPVE